MIRTQTALTVLFVFSGQSFGGELGAYNSTVTLGLGLGLNMQEEYECWTTSQRLSHANGTISSCLQLVFAITFNLP